MDERLPVPARTRQWHARKLWIGIVVAAVALPVVITRVGSRKLLLTPHDAHVQAAHGTWRNMFDLHGVAAAAPLPIWMLALLGAGVIGFPYAWVAARSLPDRGYAISKVVGVLLVGWLVWWIASLRLLPFTRGAIWLAVAVAAAGAALIARRERHELVPWIRSNWRLLVAIEVLFWLFFAAALFVRWSNPDLWHPLRGGEKPMDFAYLNAVIKSSYFPPYDPWFAGGQMNYYYYGFVQVAALVKLTGIPPAIAYNLAVPTLAALLASGSFCATFGLGSIAYRRRRALFGLAAFAALVITTFGNLGEIRVLRIAWHGTVNNDWWFWNATRVIHPGPGEPGPITEFPAFTYIYGDLHAHAMALPLAALALALVVAVVRDAGTQTIAWARVALLGLVLGALSVTNTWDLPTYALVAVSGIAIATLARDRSRKSLLHLVAALAVLGAVAYVAFLPFHLHYSSVFDGFERWQGRQSRFFDYLTVNGLFLFAIVSGLLVQLVFGRDLGSVLRSYRLAVRNWQRVGRLRALRRALVRPGFVHRVGVWATAAAALLAVAFAAAGEWPTASAIVIAVLAVLCWPARTRRGVSVVDQALRRLVVVFVVLGLALTIAVEWYVLRNIDIGRTNTVFKTYLQVWMLWGLAAAVSAGVVYRRLPELRRWVREGWRLVFVLLLASAALYPILATRAKIRDRFDTSVGHTLDGTAFMRKAIFNDKGQNMELVWDRDAIFWMLQHVDGSPIVAEVNTAPTLYGWELRYAMFTGNPAIVGWDYHQRQQRPSEAATVEDRVADVQTLYRTKDPARAYDILRRYKASYVVDGPLERTYFASGASKWSQGLGRYWTLVYSNPQVRIYKVVTTR